MSSEAGDSLTKSDDYLSSVMEQSANTFYVALIANIIIGVFCMTLFSILRTRMPWLYQPRLQPKTQKRQGPLHESLPPPPPLRGGLFSWVSDTLCMDDMTVLRVGGLDAYLYLRFFYTCFQSFSICALIACTVLIPINISNGDDSNKNNNSNNDSGRLLPLDGFDSLSLSNVKQYSHCLWVHVFVAFLFTAIILYQFDKFWQLFHSLRHDWLKKIHSHGERLAVLVEHIPTATDNYDDDFRRRWESRYPGSILDAYLVRDTGRLSAYVSKREVALEKLEAAYSDRNERRNKGDDSQPTVSTQCMCLKRTPSIDYWTSRLDDYNDRITKLQQSHSSKAFRAVPSGFVLFNNTKALYTAVRLNTFENPNEYHVMAAPHPNDVYWPALYYDFDLRSSRRIASWCIMFLLLLVFMLPVYISQAFAHIESATKDLSFLEPFREYDYVWRGLIEGVLPPVIQIAVMLILPIILHRLVRFQGVQAYSWQTLSVLAKYYLFVIFNFFFTSAVLGSVLRVLPLISRHPGTLVVLLGEAVPAVADYFVTYIILRSFSIMPLQLVRALYLVWDYVIYKCFSRTRRERYRLEESPQIDYGAEYPDHLLIFVIACTYAVISPIILPFAAAYFALGCLVFKYQLIYVFVPRFETGGLFWPVLFPRALFGVFLGQIVFIGILGLKGGVMEATVAILLPILTTVFYRRMTLNYGSRSLFLSVEECQQVDESLAKAAFNDLTQPGHNLDYKQPELRAPQQVQPDLSSTNLDGFHDYCEGADEGVQKSDFSSEHQRSQRTASSRQDVFAPLLE